MAARLYSPAAFAVVLAIVQVAVGSPLTHGWDCILCETNSMLAGNFGTSNPAFSLDDPWWLHQVARYHAVALNAFYDDRHWNGTGPYDTIAVARALKQVNPKMKVLWYQSCDRGDLSPFGQATIKAHPEWWLRDDYGNPIWFGGKTGTPTIDLTVPSAQDWIIQWPESHFNSTIKHELAELVDGMFYDGCGLSDYHNMSDSRLIALQKGRRHTLVRSQEYWQNLNSGDVWANGNLYGHHAPSPVYPTLNWTDSPVGAFEEMIGSFSSMDPDGEWNSDRMNALFEAAIGLSSRNKTVVLHPFVGPADPPFIEVGQRPRDFHVASWKGPIAGPTTPQAARAAASQYLVQSLAPFLIVANEHVFFAQSWFYSLEDGYIPCPEDKAECGMPSSWYPEFSKPLGPPLGPAKRNGNVWTREYEHCSVYVDAGNRSTASVTWKA
eukprot:m.24985 g.24985  ORF g.24985 m.24985 type:complete len:437 (-) comp7692_c0_seq2:233-1543(-)